MCVRFSQAYNHHNKFREKLILRTIEPDITDLSNNIITMQQTPVADTKCLNETNIQTIRDQLLIHLSNPDDDLNVFPNSKLKLRKDSILTIESGYCTSESSRKASIESENDDAIIQNIPSDIRKVEKPQIVTIKTNFHNTEVTEAIEYDSKLRTKHLVNQLLIDIYGRPYSEIGGNLDSPILQNLESDCTSVASFNDENGEVFNYCVENYSNKLQKQGS